MNAIYYRLNQDLNPNKIMHDIQSMIKDHARLNKSLEDTILRIEVKDITYTHDERALQDARETEMRKPAQNDN